MHSSKKADVLLARFEEYHSPTHLPIDAVTTIGALLALESEIGASVNSLTNPSHVLVAPLPTKIAQPPTIEAQLSVVIGSPLETEGQLPTTIAPPIVLEEVPLPDNYSYD